MSALLFRKLPLGGNIKAVLRRSLGKEPYQSTRILFTTSSNFANAGYLPDWTHTRFFSVVVGFLTANVVCFRDPSDQWMNAIHNMRQGERDDPALHLTKFDCKLN